MHEVCDDYDIEYLKSMNWCEILEHYEYEWYISQEYDSYNDNYSNSYSADDFTTVDGKVVLSSDNLYEWVYSNPPEGEIVYIQGVTIDTIYTNALYCVWGMHSEDYNGDETLKLMKAVEIFMIDTTGHSVGNRLSTVEAKYIGMKRKEGTEYFGYDWTWPMFAMYGSPEYENY